MQRQYQGLDRSGVWQVPQDGGEQGDNCLQSLLWCQKDSHGLVIENDDNDDDADGGARNHFTYPCLLCHVYAVIMTVAILTTRRNHNSQAMLKTIDNFRLKTNHLRHLN